MVAQMRWIEQHLPILANIPDYMQQIPNWGVATSNKIPVATKYANRGPIASKLDDNPNKVFSLDDIMGRATHFPPTFNSSKPETWSTFADVQQVRFGSTARSSNGDFVAALGFVLKLDCNLRCFDLDRDKTIEEFNALQIKNNRPEVNEEQYSKFIEHRQPMRNLILGYFPEVSAREISMSGEALHIWVYDRNNTQNLKGPFGEVYRQNQLIYMTGHCPTGQQIQIIDDQARVDACINDLLNIGYMRVAADVDPKETNAIMQAISLVGDRVGSATHADMKAYIDASAPFVREWYYEQTMLLDTKSSDKSSSQAVYNLTNHLEKKFGNPETILEFVLNSPRVLGHHTGAKAYQDKVLRTFPTMFARNRASNAARANNVVAVNAAMMREQMQVVTWGAPETIPVITPESQVAATEVANFIRGDRPMAAPGKKPRLSPKVVEVIQAYAGLAYTDACREKIINDMNYRQSIEPNVFRPITALQAVISPEMLGTTRPKGIIYDMIQCAYRGMYEPLEDFAVFATLAMLAALNARRVKLPYSQDGVLFHAILLARTAVGKDEALRVWDRLITEVATGLNNPVVSKHKRFRKLDAGSKQGISLILAEDACFCDTNTEADEEIRIMAGISKNANETSFQNFKLNAYDYARPTAVFSPSTSVSGKERGDRDVYNAAVSQLYASTIEKCDGYVNMSFIESGGGNRQLIAVYDAASGINQSDSAIYRRIPPEYGHVRRTLETMINLAAETDMVYTPMTDSEDGKIIPGLPHGYEKGITTCIYGEGAEHWLQAFKDRCNSVKRFYQDGSERSYDAFFRVSSMVGRIAGLLAVANNPVTPIITVYDLEWSAGFILRRLGETVTNFETGVFGQDISRGPEIVVNCAKTLLRGVYRNDNYLPWGVFRSYVTSQRTFRKEGANASRLAEAAIQICINDGIFSEAHIETAGKRNKKRVFLPLEHPVWDT